MVDDASEEPTSPHNGAPSPRENGLDKLQPKRSTRHIAPGTTLSSNRLCLNNYNVSLDYSLHLTAFSVPKLYVEHKYVIIALSF